MTLLLAIVAGALFAGGIYMVLQRSLSGLLVGLLLLSNGANLAVFVSGGLIRGVPPLVQEGAATPPIGAADPLPQALVLTAIVIGFAVIAFAAALLWRAHEECGTDDPDELRSTDR